MYLKTGGGGGRAWPAEDSGTPCLRKRNSVEAPRLLGVSITTGTGSSQLEGDEHDE